MNQSNSAELYDFPDDFCLDIPNVNNPHRTLDETSDVVSRTAIFKSAVSRNNTNFDPKWQVAATDLQAAIKQASDQAAKKWLVEHGYGNGHDCRLRVHSEPRVSVKPMAGSGNAFNAIIQTLLTLEGALQTQASVRSKVQAMCPTVPVTKNWNQPLPSWAINKVMARVACLGSPFDTIKLKKKSNSE